MIKIMNKNAIKKFAIEARQEMISRVSQRAAKYGISENETGNPMDEIVDGYLLSPTEQMQRAALIEQIKEKGYEQVREEVAYTWFNRFCALRYMEVNGYLPTRIRVFTDENNEFKPQILAEAIHLDLEGLDIEKVYGYKEANETDELYKYLLITQCNALSKVLPGMFQTISDYTELLFPDNILREGSTISKMIDMIDEEDWKDAVEIIGWLYQYYNSEKKDEVFSALKDNVKITKENIPAATQLFTPDWIVRYMVENSLGRLWIEGHPNEELKSQWKYYLEEAKQEEEVEKQLEEIREEYKKIKPDEIKCLDPCSGSGHILVYMFDLLMEIYQTQGYNTRSAVKSIVENNIYGLDLDDRAAQLTYFSLMMKARQYDRGFLNRGIQPHAYAIVESNHVDRHALEYFCNGDAKLKEAMDTIIAELHDAKEYGSIITVSDQDWDALYARFDEIENERVLSIYTDSTLRLKQMVQVAETLAQKYDVVVTNPPYAGAKGLNEKLGNYIEHQYQNEKSDLYAVFVSKSCKLSKYICSMVTPITWMYNPTFKEFRKILINSIDIVSLLELGADAFDSGFGTASYTYYVKQHNIQGKYYDLTNNTEKNKFLHLSYQVHSIMDFYDSDYKINHKVPNILRSIIRTKNTLNNTGTACIGLQTNDNKRFIRDWYEVSVQKLSLNHKKNTEYQLWEKWFPIVKYTSNRKWYGNLISVVDWESDGMEIKKLILEKGESISRYVRSKSKYFQKGLTWSHSTFGGSFSMRVLPESAIINIEGPGIFDLHEHFYYVLALMNSNVASYIFETTTGSIHVQSSDINNFPYCYNRDNAGIIDQLAKNSVIISETDWDSYETSWNFKRHPLLRKVSNIEEAFDQWENECYRRFDQLKANEEELNRIFIDIYGLQDELTPEVEDRDITVYRVFDNKEDVPESMNGSRYVRTKQDEIISFISYAVGCMFGRYSLDVDGLAYAGGDWDESKYSTFKADGDNIIPICDDEYFDDDIVGRFIKFVETVYGKDSLQENLEFIADALGGKGQPKDVIRKYFLNDFYKDHCKIYQKRPIYWMFDSGKKNGFKCLIYMHRYKPDILARIRTDYVHEQQSRYRTLILDLEKRIGNASTSERVKLNKKLQTLNDQAKEIQDYEEKIHHLADQMISIDLDDGVVNNYQIFKDVLAKIK